MFTPHNVSHVTCHMSRVTCHVSHVTCQVSHFIFIFFFFSDKVVEHIGGGSVINGASPSSFFIFYFVSTISTKILLLWKMLKKQWISKNILLLGIALIYGVVIHGRRIIFFLHFYDSPREKFSKRKTYSLDPFYQHYPPADKARPFGSYIFTDFAPIFLKSTFILVLACSKR